MMEDSEREKALLTSTVALAAAKLNLTCMEATFALADRKTEMRLLGRRNLAGLASMHELMADGNEWERNLDKRVTSIKERHTDALKRLEEESNTERRLLETDMQVYEGRIRAADKAMRLASDEFERHRGVQVVNPDTIGDLPRLRRNVDELRRTVRTLEGQGGARGRENGFQPSFRTGFH